jgi:hypothetical protein
MLMILSPKPFLDSLNQGLVPFAIRNQSLHGLWLTTTTADGRRL